MQINIRVLPGVFKIVKVIKGVKSVVINSHGHYELNCEVRNEED